MASRDEVTTTNRTAVVKTPEDVADAPRSRLTSLARPLLLPLAAYAASRVLTALAIGLAAFAARQPVRKIVTIWDGRWYEKIALHGYPMSVPQGDFYEGTGRQVQSTVAFFPLYPMLVRALDAVLPGSAAIAGVVLSLLIGAAATVVVWLITAKISDRQQADRAAVLFCFSPGAFVLSLVYAEGLLVLLAAACLLALLERRWVLAGVLGALATATRPNAIAVACACAWAAGMALWRHRDWRALLAPVLAPMGMAAFFAFLWWRTGEPLIWFRVEADGWGERTDFGRSNAEVFLAFLRHPFADPNYFVLAVSFVLTVVLVALLVRARLPGVLNVYAGVALLLVLTSHINVRPRFVFVAFPLVVALAGSLRRSTFAVLAASFAASTVLLTVFYGLHRQSFYP